MLTITVGAIEHFNEATSTIEFLGGTVLELEHSLVSLSKWEAKHEKPFLGQDEKTPEEILSYVHCMILTPNVPEDVLYALSKSDFEKISEYMNAKMTATWFSNLPQSKSSETITADLIYYWMMTSNIDLEMENRHLSKLFTLLKVFAAKQEKPKKQSKQDAAAERRALNAKRLAEMGIEG